MCPSSRGCDYGSGLGFDTASGKAVRLLLPVWHRDGFITRTFGIVDKEKEYDNTTWMPLFFTGPRPPLVNTRARISRSEWRVLYLFLQGSFLVTQRQRGNVFMRLLIVVKHNERRV